MPIALYYGRGVGSLTAGGNRRVKSNLKQEQSPTIVSVERTSGSNFLVCFFVYIKKRYALLINLYYTMKYVCMKQCTFSIKNLSYKKICVCVCVCAHARVRSCVRAFVRACVSVCVCELIMQYLSRVLHILTGTKTYSRVLHILAGAAYPHRY